SNPSFYVCTPTFTDHSISPKNTDICFVMVPIPNNIEIDNELAFQYKKNIFNIMQSKMGIDKIEEYKDIQQIIVLTDGYIEEDDLVRRKKPLMVMLYNVSNSTDEIIKHKHEYYYLTNE
ncbi:MAG: hypothetical protein QXF12_07960, partial [Candidatus Aenigmatarchaeota archaeon]